MRLIRFPFLQPSSSGKAAELLAKDKGTVPGFVGFGATHNELAYVPAIQGLEEVDSLVDADFRMVLRKMSKRDATTKLKVYFIVAFWFFSVDINASASHYKFTQLSTFSSCVSLKKK